MGANVDVLLWQHGSHICGGLTPRRQNWVVWPLLDKDDPSQHIRHSHCIFSINTSKPFLRKTEKSLAVSPVRYPSQMENPMCVGWGGGGGDKYLSMTFLSGLQMKDRPIEDEVLTAGPVECLWMLPFIHFIVLKVISPRLVSHTVKSATLPSSCKIYCLCCLEAELSTVTQMLTHNPKS